MEHDKWLEVIDYNYIQHVVDNVNERGMDNHIQECDNYEQLLVRKEFSDLVMYEIYEAYFYADRHEFDLLLIEELVKSAIAFFTSEELREANTTLRQYLIQNIPAIISIEICTYIKKRFHINKERNIKYDNIKSNIDKIQKYFKKELYIDTEKIRQIFDEDEMKIIPLLKLLGCKHYINDGQDFWMKPE